MLSVKEKIREYIANHFYILSSERVNISDTDNIFKLGIVNSMFAMQLVRFIETEFNYFVSEEDLKVDNFCCIENMIRLLNKKK